MIKKIVSLGVVVILISCKGGDKSPVMSTNSEALANTEHTASVITEKKDVNIESTDGQLSIAEILKNRKKYNGQMVTVKGEVTKFNPAILNTNWVHIQDGTEFDGDFDLTLTTKEVVKVGSEVTFRGKIVLDKDFGYGYFYETLMEESIIVE